MRIASNPFGVELFASAACNQPEVDPEIFHSYRDGDIAKAKAVCRRCPVQAQCLIAADVAALIGQEMEAVLGGMTFSERNHRRRVLKLQRGREGAA
jgi:hypothetical protein